MLYRQIILEWGQDTESGVWGLGYSPDNGKNFYVLNTTHGRKYRAEDGNRLYPYISDQVQDKIETVVAPAKSAADSAVAYANDAIEKSRVNSQAIVEINSAVSDAVSGAAVARSDGLRAWNAAQSNVNLIDLNYTSASASISSARTEAIAAADEAKASASAAQADIVAVRSDVAAVQAEVTDFGPALKSAQSDAGKALTQIADTANALSETKAALTSDVAVAKNLANAAQTTANSAVESASENAKALTSQANALSDARKAMDSDIANAKELANTAQTTANSAIESASSVANDLAAVASQAKANTNGITKVTSDVGLLQTTVADNSGNISKIQETATQIQQAVSDNSGAIVVAKQTADSAATVASDAKSNATVAVQTASGASVTAKNAQGDATTAMVTAQSAVTQASDAKSNATIAVQTASEASVTATNAQGDASFAKQTASDASVQIKNAQGDISKLQTRAGTIETSVANNSGAIADVKATANQLKASVSDNAGNITVAKQTADSAVAVASDARSNATVASQTASQASITAQNASGQAASAVLTANGAMTTASNAQSNATVAVQTASGASLTATNAQSDATIAKQTASEAKVQASNAESDYAQLSIRANKIEANVANNSGAIASVQQTANGLTTTVADIKANGGGVNLLRGTSDVWTTLTVSGSMKVTTANDTKTSVADYHGGDKFTYSAVITNKSDTNVRLEMYRCDINGIRMNGNSNHALSDSVAPNTTAKKVSFTIAIDGNTWFVEHTLIADDGGTSTSKTVQIKDEMFEVGTVAHDWSPAPDDVQNQFTKINESINGVTTIINDPKTGLNATYQTAAGNATTISNAQGDIAKLKTRADGFDAQFADTNGNISKLQADASGTKQTLANTKSDVAVLQSRADGLDAKYADAAGDINTLKANASGFSQTLVSVKGDISTLQSTATGLKNTLTDAQGNISTLQSDVSGLKKTTSDNAGNISTLQSTANTLTSQMSSAQGDISTLKQTTSGISSQVSGMSGDLNNLKSQAQWLIVYDTVDLNNIKTPCHEFLKGGVTNGPNETAWWYLTVEGSEDDRITQTVIADQSNNRYTRRFADSWSAWVRDATQTDVTTLSNLIAANTTAIEQNKNAITLKADQTTVDKTNGDVQQLQSQLKVQAGQIASKVSSSDLDAKGYATQTYTQTQIKQTADSWNANLTKLKNDTQTGFTNISVGIEGLEAQVYNSDGSSKITQLSNLIATKVSSGDYNSQIAQLKDAINLRVAKGDVISQINQEAGGDTLIQVSNGKKSLILDANNTIVTGKAWIPDAAISSISADKIMLGSSALYNSDGTLNLVNERGNLKALIQVKQGLVQDTTQSIISFSSDYNNRAFSVTPVGATITPTLFFERYDQTAGHWLGFTRNEVRRDGLMFHTWDDEGERFFVGCHARFDRNISVDGTISQGTWNGTSGKPEAGILTIKSGNTIWSGSDFLAIGDHISNSFTNVMARSFSQQSTLSSKTNIETVDPKYALDLVNRTDILSYQYKADVAQGKTKRYTSMILDDVNDVSKYYAPDEFANEERTGRDDGSAVGYLFLAVQELTRRIKNLEEKLHE